MEDITNLNEPKEVLDTSLFGISLEEVTKIHNTLDDLKNSQSGIVVVKCINNFELSLNHEEFQKFKIGDQYVMPLGLYDKTKAYRIEENGTEVLKPSYIPNEEPFAKFYKRYNGEDLSGKTLFIWRTGGIGDIIFIQPCLRYIKKKFPTCKIWFACSSAYLPILYGWDFIDEKFSIPFKLEKLIQSDYHCTFEGVIERCREAETTNAYKLFEKWMQLDIPEDEMLPILYTKKNDDKYVKRILENKLQVRLNDYICVQPKASVLLRSPSIGHWLQIIADIIFNYKQTIIFTSLPHEHELLERAINSHIKPEYKNYIKHFTKYSTDVGKLMSLVKFSKLVIAPDSSTIHIAAGLNKKSYGIYGPFPGEIRLSTYKKCKWIEPRIQQPICNWFGRHCCLHKNQVCPNHKQYISPCFDYIDFSQARNDIIEMLNLKR